MGRKSTLATLIVVLAYSQAAAAQSSFPSESESESEKRPSKPIRSSSDRPAPSPRLTPRLVPRPPGPATSPPPSRAPSQSTTPAPSPSSGAPKAAVAPLPPRPTTAPSPQPGGPSAPGVPAASFAPPLLPAYKKMEPPPGYVDKSKWNVALLAGGGLVLTVTYGTAIAYGASQNFENGLGALGVPVFGPWMALGQRDFTCNIEQLGLGSNVDDVERSQAKAQACIANQTATAGFLVGLGVGQLVGASLLTVGLLDHKRQWVRMDLAGIEAEFDFVATPSWSGLTARGRF